MAKKSEAKTDPERPPSFTEILKEDVVGVSDFKRSKVGALTGFSAASKVVSGVKGQVANSIDRTGTLFKDLMAKDDVPSLPDNDGDARERFVASMRLHRKTDKDIAAIVRNSCRSSRLYLALSVIGTLASAWSIYAYPIAGLMDLTARIGPLPLIYALTMKHVYTNWMVRHRKLDSFSAFLKSGDWLPKMP